MNLPNFRLMLRRTSKLRLRWIIYPLVAWIIIGVTFTGSRQQWLGPAPFEDIFYRGAKRAAFIKHTPLAERVSCLGARGLPLNESRDDELRYGDLSAEYPTPFIGSQMELGLRPTWMTAEGRYGPYGLGEDSDDYGRSKVDWNMTNWGKLQDECLNLNSHRFPSDLKSTQIGRSPRFTNVEFTELDASPSWDVFEMTQRTAIVLRSYSGFEYKPETMWMIRSLITEAALRTGGEYAVFLLVDVQGREEGILGSMENYYKAFEDAHIPPELASITVLWDEHMLKSWYSQIEEHATMWQVTQPLQLFALHHPEFDHYWQLEMDQRFIGDAGEYLDALDKFSRDEPRKQALERSTFPYSEQIYTSYNDLIRGVDYANVGKSRAWGSLRIAEVSPIGPTPPTEKPQDDDFLWGVGEEADLIVSSFCAEARGSNWIFKDWMHGSFQLDRDTPRWFCPPAITRSSRSLLISVHKDMFTRGLSLASEAVLPSWALWLGLKVSYPPSPSYMHPYDVKNYEDKPVEEQDEVSRLHSEWRLDKRPPFFGVMPNETADGLSHADPQSFGDKGLTFWWASDWPRTVMDVWLNGTSYLKDEDDLPSMFTIADGQIYAPNFMMHPVKV